MSGRGFEHLGGDRWRVRAYAGLDPTSGAQRQRSRSFRAPNLRAAARMAPGEKAALQAEIDAERELEAAHAGTVGELLGRYLDFKRPRWSPSTAARNAHIARVIATDLGQLRLEALTTFEVDQWYVTLVERGLAPLTVRHYGRLLNAALRQAQRWGQVTVRATENATAPPTGHREVSPPTAAVVQLLIDRARGPLRAAIVAAAHGGLRRGEILGLCWDDISGPAMTVRRSVLEVAGGQVVVKGTKTGRQRTLTMPRQLQQALRDQQAHQAKILAGLGVTATPAFVFADLAADPTGGTPMRPGWLSTAWMRHRARCGASSVRFHDLRHWHATTLIDSGIPIPTVSKRLGHQQPQTTMNIYAHAMPTRDLDAAAVIDRTGRSAAGGRRLQVVRGARPVRAGRPAGAHVARHRVRHAEPMVLALQPGAVMPVEPLEAGAAAAGVLEVDG